MESLKTGLTKKKVNLMSIEEVRSRYGILEKLLPRWSKEFILGS